MKIPFYFIFLLTIFSCEKSDEIEIVDGKMIVFQGFRDENCDIYLEKYKVDSFSNDSHKPMIIYVELKTNFHELKNHDKNNFKEINFITLGLIGDSTNFINISSNAFQLENSIFKNEISDNCSDEKISKVYFENVTISLSQNWKEKYSPKSLYDIEYMINESKVNIENGIIRFAFFSYNYMFTNEFLMSVKLQLNIDYKDKDETISILSNTW